MYCFCFAANGSLLLYDYFDFDSPFSIPGSREEEAIKLDGLSVAEMKQLREQAEKFAFQAEVNRMMKLIINSLYRNKEVCVLIGVFARVKSLIP